MIGLFDSGSGGLTVLAALQKKRNSVDAIYFGDIKNAPYGNKSPQELAALTEKGVEILRRHGAKELVSACNSISASLLAGAAGDMPCIEMSRPTAQYLFAHPGKKFLVLATPTTVNSGLYARAVGERVDLEHLPILELARAIEFGEAEERIREIVLTALETKRNGVYDGVVLACTHYPLVDNSITEAVQRFWGDIDIIDPAYPVAQEVVDQFEMTGDGTLTFLISKDSPLFREKVHMLFPESKYEIKVIE